MGKMIIHGIRRTKVGADDFRIVAVNDKGEEVTLKTPILKLNEGTAYRKLGGVKPMEQYAFKVGARRVDRFDEACALVLRRHHCVLAADAIVPGYAQRAVTQLAN